MLISFVWWFALAGLRTLAVFVGLMVVLWLLDLLDLLPDSKIEDHAGIGKAALQALFVGIFVGALLFGDASCSANSVAVGGWNSTVIINR
jgi:hypothetical protein